MNRPIRRLALLATLLGGSLAALSADQQGDSWQPLFQGVDYRLVVRNEPRPLRIHEVRIDTRAPGLRFFTTPDNGERAEEVDGRTTGSFLDEFDLELAINGSAFQPIAAEGQPVNVAGLSISDGRTVSPPDFASGNPVFLVDRDGAARILTAASAGDALDDARQALQGHYGQDAMLVDDATVSTAGRDLHPRTAVGVSRDGRWVRLVVVDGRQPGFSEGMTLVELADWLKDAGCWDAMNLDGGGSSTLASKAPDGAVRVLNSPSAGTQRSVGNHLGIHARTLAP